MWIELRARVQTHIGNNDEVAVLINMGLVRKVTPGDRRDGGCKLIYMDGHVDAVLDSYNMVKAKIEGNLSRGYVAPEPKV